MFFTELSLKKSKADKSTLDFFWYAVGPVTQYRKVHSSKHTPCLNNFAEQNRNKHSICFSSPHKVLRHCGDPRRSSERHLAAKQAWRLAGDDARAGSKILAHWTPTKHCAPHPSAWAGVRFPWSCASSRPFSVFFVVPDGFLLYFSYSWWCSRSMDLL